MLAILYRRWNSTEIGRTLPCPIDVYDIAAACSSGPGSVPMPAGAGFMFSGQDNTVMGRECTGRVSIGQNYGAIHFYFGSAITIC